MLIWLDPTATRLDEGDHQAGRSAVHGATLWQVRRSLLVLIVPLLIATGCSEVNDRISDSVNSAASNALADGIRDQLADAGIELDGDPDCSTDLSRDGATLSGTATCDATTSDGLDATADFDGTLSSSGCAGTVTVVVEGRTVVEGREIPDCSVSL